uniref:Uncharacterized protein n=2 Tax=Arabidopsis thaliana TaxID=3702 RepID=Q56W22_ARATH|nr:hypothetical protein [Arabidopsis thaliana]
MLISWIARDRRKGWCKRERSMTGSVVSLVPKLEPRAGLCEGGRT